MRAWLNGSFFDAAFSAAEKQLVQTTRCTDNGDDSPDTLDRVFLLSVAEVQAVTGVLGKEFRRTTGTEYARVRKADGCRLYVYDKSVEANYVVESGRKLGCSWWWLRSQPSSPSRAAFVGTRASIRSYGRVDRTPYGVRPALKLKLP